MLPMMLMLPMDAKLPKVLILRNAVNGFCHCILLLLPMDANAANEFCRWCLCCQLANAADDANTANDDTNAATNVCCQ